MQRPETEVVECDVLIVGGGMAGCGAAYETAYWAKQHGLKVTLVDKAAMERSGAVAMGLSAINCYIGTEAAARTRPRTTSDYVRNDLMGITREDLVDNIARHVDSTVHTVRKVGPAHLEGREGRLRSRGPLAGDDQRRVLQGRSSPRRPRTPSARTNIYRAGLHLPSLDGQTDRTGSPARSASPPARTSSTCSRPRPWSAPGRRRPTCWQAARGGRGPGPRSGTPPFNTGSAT